MRRYAIFVDAGYFFAAGGFALNQKVKTPRRSIKLIDPASTVASLQQLASVQTGGADLLRTYWYDAMISAQRSLEQSVIAHLPGVKLRLGSFNGGGEQKGVDSHIVTDLIELARNRAITDAVLVTGDEDLRLAVVIAQSYGVRAHLCGVANIVNNTSQALRMEADTVAELDIEWLQQHMSITVPTVVAPALAPAAALLCMTGSGKSASVEEAPAALPAPAAPKELPLPPDLAAPLTLEGAAQFVAMTLITKAVPADRQSLLTHLAGNKTIPPEFDRPFIAKTSAEMKRPLLAAEMRTIRGVFVKMARDHA